VYLEGLSTVNRSSGKPLHIILIEDDEIDAEAIERAFTVLGIAVKATRFVDGRAAIDALRSPWGSQLQNEPHLILLDLNMPRMNGLTFLDELRQEPVLRRSIVFALTGSDEEQDRAAAYDRRVAGYLVKSTLGRDYSALRDLLDVYYQAIEFPIG
jgi:CheY-like chemotaxis protein